MSFLTIKQLYKKFGDVTVLQDVNLSIEEGEFFALLGPSGCGKTTTMRCIAGFEEVTAGNIYINGNDVSNAPANERQCGMVFQSYALFPHMTVFDNVAYSLHIKRYQAGNLLGKSAVLLRLLNKRLGNTPSNIKKAVNEMLDFVELGHLAERLPGQLSGGQQQRVALARSLIMEPSVLLMDEPLSNLDKKLRGSMRDTIRNIQKETGITTLFVTHDQEEAMSMADRVAVMNDGQVIQVDKPTELYKNPKTKMVADFVGSSNIINGTIKHSGDKGDTIIQIDEDYLLKSTYRSQKQEVQVLIRPENIKLRTEKSPTKSGNVLKGKISLVTYLGSIIRYNINVGSHTFFADVVFDQMLEVGTTIYIEVSPDKVVII